MNQSSFWWRKRLLYLQPEIKQTLHLNGASLQAAAPTSCAASAPGASSPAQKLNAGRSLAEATIGEPAPKAMTVEESVAEYLEFVTKKEEKATHAEPSDELPEPVDMRTPEQLEAAKRCKEWFEKDDAPF